jgi:hypothetical protein
MPHFLSLRAVARDAQLSRFRLSTVAAVLAAIILGRQHARLGVTLPRSPLPFSPSSLYRNHRRQREGAENSIANVTNNKIRICATKFVRLPRRNISRQALRSTLQPPHNPQDYDAIRDNTSLQAKQPANRCVNLGNRCVVEPKVNR